MSNKTEKELFEKAINELKRNAHAFSIDAERLAQEITSMDFNKLTIDDMNHINDSMIRLGKCKSWISGIWTSFPLLAATSIGRNMEESEE